jgi:predicted membrane protein
LGGRWQRDMQIEVRSAVGNVKITAPPTIGVELETPGILSRTDVSGAFTKAGGVWRSANFSSASVKVRVVVRTMLGKVELVQR